MPTESNLLFRDSETEPTDEVIQETLGTPLFNVYRELIEIIQTEFDLAHEWRYYKDGKSWLCKVVHKKKTIFWLSIWEGIIKIGFYFNEKTSPGVFDLQIDEEIKRDFEKTKPVGKLLPLVLDINQQAQLQDLKEVIRYKKSLK